MTNKDHYTYRITWSEDDQEFVGLCAEFPSLSWLDDSPQAALTGILDIVASCIADMQQAGEKIPEPIADREYSGKFIVRVPGDTHRALALKAAENGTSINRIVSEKLAQV